MLFELSQVSCICVTYGLLTEQSKQTNFTCVFSRVKTSHHDFNAVGVTHLETEDHQAELTLSSNLKIWVTPQIGLKELCHLNALKKTKGKKSLSNQKLNI